VPRSTAISFAGINEPSFKDGNFITGARLANWAKS
jgi:hypothetical protein